MKILIFYIRCYSLVDKKTLLLLLKGAVDLVLQVLLRGQRLPQHAAQRAAALHAALTQHWRLHNKVGFRNADTI